MGAVGSTGTTAANALAAEADVVIGVGTRWSDFTTASRTAFQDNGVRFVNVNVARFDAGKHAGLSVVADAREALTALTAALDGYCRRRRPTASARPTLWRAWDAQVEAAYHPPAEVTDALAEGLLTQGEVLGVVNELSRPARRRALRGRLDARRPAQAVAGPRPQGATTSSTATPAWATRSRPSIGVRLADETPRRVRDGRRRRLPDDADRARHRGPGAGQGRSSCWCRTTASTRSARSRSRLGSQRFGTRYRYRDDATGRLDGDPLPVDLAANARSLGAHVIEVHSRGRARAGDQGGQGGARRRRPGRHPRRDRPDRARARQRALVGRAGQRRSASSTARRPPTRPTWSTRPPSARCSERATLRNTAGARASAQQVGGIRRNARVAGWSTRGTGRGHGTESGAWTDAWRSRRPVPRLPTPAWPRRLPVATPSTPRSRRWSRR